MSKIDRKAIRKKRAFRVRKKIAGIVKVFDPSADTDPAMNTTSQELLENLDENGLN